MNEDYTASDPRSWVQRIQKGDVLRTRNGTLRIVRAVSRSQSFWGLRVNVAFAIRHPSWTTRAYTVYTGNDLVQMGYRPTGAKSKLNTAFDWAFEQEIGADINQCKMRAQDVIGIP